MSPRPLLLGGTPPGSQTSGWLEKHGRGGGHPLEWRGQGHGLASLPERTAHARLLKVSVGTRRSVKGLCLLCSLFLGSEPPNPSPP